MDMSEAERRELGVQIRKQRERAFGTKKAAYDKAQVNPGTWDKAEAGESIRGDRLRQIVRTLWPASEGDWTQITDVGGSDYVAAPGQQVMGSVDDSEVLREIRAVREEVRALSERLANVEQQGS